MTPTCTILAVNHNARRFVELCVKGVLKSAACSELVVLDNGSTDGSIEFLSSIPRVKLIRRNVPFGEGPSPAMCMNEHGIAIDQYLAVERPMEWVLLMDSDAYPVKPSFDQLLISFAGDSDIMGYPIGGYTSGGGRPFSWRLHPATLLIRSAVFRSVKTSFAPVRKDGVVFDTAGMFIHDAAKAGLKVKTVEWPWMNTIVRHRSGGTRGEFWRRHKADFPTASVGIGVDEWLSRHDKSNEVWFGDPTVKEILGYKP